MPKKSGKKSTATIVKWNKKLEISPNVSEISMKDLATLSALSKMKTQTDCYTIKMVYDTSVITDGAGVYAVTYADDPSADSNWAAAASFFDEYRTLATVVKFSPNITSGGTLLTYAPFVVVNDYDSSAALTGYTLASQYSSVKEYKGNSGWTYKAVMSGLENGSFLSTASHAARWWVKTYSSGNTASTTIGRIQIQHYVQFRGKGI